ncbi:MAG: T9SS type A sorting domain-containing protein [Ignavibacterium album]|uniref:T9SS type A sorting domain-containing protein n=1 Tax=Ignavibacterium album TaxID=591197 RepID=UPI0026EE4FBD|nr:T9SS type A sorting domain-containing protein [Ignavibacterium album]MCX8105658.1 T9SS type A sorting domain-containing protein [Ignavibacterium album]
MFNKNLIWFLMIFSSLLISQTKITEVADVSPDNSIKISYQLDEAKKFGEVIKLSDDIPFGTAPDWSSTLERQIGGMAWGDYDDDGDLDLATGCYFSQSYPPIPEYEVLIYINDNGILTSTPAWISTDMRSTTDVKFADLNNDGKPELIAANGDQSFVPSVIYFNGPNGLSNSPGWISQDNNWTVGAALCDIDDDGDLDLAFGNQGNTVIPTKPICVFYNSGGTYPTIPNWLSADEMITNSVAFGDLDNAQIKYSFVEFFGDGVRHVFPLRLYPIYSIDTVLVDDIPYHSYCYDPIGGWISLGTVPQSGFTIKISYRYIAKGDLAASKWVNYQSGVYYNNNGVLNSLPNWTVGNTQSQKGIAWADFDRDGFMDLAISGSSVQTVIYKNNNGTLIGPVWTSNSVNPSAQELITGDLDNDGYPELAVVHFGTKRIEVFKNRNGILDTDPTWIYIAGSSATSISFGDMNGDGYLDLAVGTARTPAVVFLNQSSVIPVELSSFSYTLTNNDVELKWATTTETNNRGFEILRSVILSEAKNLSWEVIGFVKGSGSTTEPKNYTFVDKNLNSGKYLYRLKQIDFDGSSKFSNELEVTIESPEQFILEQNYPNPFNPVTKISYTIPAKGEGLVTLKLYDMLGNEIATLVNEKQNPGRYEIEFDADKYSLSSGVYLYKLVSGEYTAIRKFILAK